MLEISGIGVVVAFLAGVVSFLSPCVLPLVPGYVSYITGRTLGDDAGSAFSAQRFRALGLAAFFVAGFSLVFIALGASASLLGQLLLPYRYEANIAAGVLVILFGMFMTGLLPLGWLRRELRFHGRIEGGHATGALALGGAFAFGWTPCIGPVLAAILAIGANPESGLGGPALLAVYAAGLAVPFLAVAACTDWFAPRLARARRLGRALQIGAGALMVLMGVAMITGYLSSFGFWLLDTFPVFEFALL